MQFVPQLDPASGLAVGLSTPQGQYDYVRDPVGRIIDEQAPGAIRLRRGFNGPLLVSEATDQGSTPQAAVGYQYDANFWLSRLQVAALAGSAPSSDRIDYVYDNDGLLIFAQVPSQASMALTRDPQNGLLTGTALGLVTDSWSYNAFAEPSGYAAQFDATALFATSYSRDKLGRITQKVETVAGASETSDYSYDLAGRLDTVTVDGALIADYAYDANSNRIGVAQTGVGMPTQGCVANLASVSATVDAQDRLLTYGNCTYQYTDNGELTAKTDTSTSAQTTYQYDTFSNLRHVSLPDGRAIDYAIDGRNRRIGKTIDGVKVQGLVYVSDLEPVAETDGQGNRIATFIYADRANTPSYLLKAGRVYRVISDHLGSVRLVVDIQDGSIAQRLDYDAWGQVLEDTNPGFQPFGFAGGIYDQDTGLVRFGARDYDPEVGRWTNKDPIGFGARMTNLYLYVNSDPINLIDQTGLSAGSAALAFAGGAISAVVGGVVVAGLIATGTVVGAVVAVGLVAVGGYALGTAIYEAGTGYRVASSEAISTEDRIDIAAGAAGGLAGGAFCATGIASGREFSFPFLKGPTGKPMRIAPFGNRTGHPLGEYPHFHRAVADPNNPGRSLPGQGIGQHRPWEGGF